MTTIKSCPDLVPEIFKGTCLRTILKFPRVTTRRHNSSNAKSESRAKLSDTKLSYPLGVHSKDNIGIVRDVEATKEIECPQCRDLLSKNQELQDALEANSKFTPASQLIGTERVYSIAKERWYILTEAMKKSEKACFAIFDNTGSFVYAEADLERMTRDVSPDSKN
jgi:hypothetical protein